MNLVIARENRMKQRKWLLSTVLLLLMLVAIAGIHSLLLAAQAGKIEPGLRAQVAREGQGTYFVHLDEQADLEAAFRITDRSGRGRYVLEELHHTAAMSQLDLVQFLELERVAGNVRAYQSLFSNGRHPRGGWRQSDWRCSRSAVDYRQSL